MKKYILNVLANILIQKEQNIVKHFLMNKEITLKKLEKLEKKVLKDAIIGKICTMKKVPAQHILQIR